MRVKRIINKEDLQTAFAIRKEVFVEEQHVPLEVEYDEYDTLNGLCEHVLVYYHEQPVGTGRVRPVDQYGKLERICVLKPFRSYGLGKVIIQALEDTTANNGQTRVKLHGQTQAEGFYKKLGYTSSSDIFMEDGIPHVLMTKDLIDGKS
ncbi:GNAT family N-acetyltransferase [Sporosarcina sp. PTS2304]|uniref:GNAT family N-acetyltransferase n=1 Tax=Sporosarcina sp. PTS2304 TaxID=2283194 RepID=UPI000E0D9E84|nr:GNAT family N-acetyltransferase [Sporosarcina sp. PTS2304]AXH99143.1 GNAT family N-acetyltransferase [Sporosarcina sp. PTS2304]